MTDSDCPAGMVVPWLREVVRKSDFVSILSLLCCHGESGQLVADANAADWDMIVYEKMKRIRQTM